MMLPEVNYFTAVKQWNIMKSDSWIDVVMKLVEPKIWSAMSVSLAQNDNLVQWKVLLAMSF